MPTLRSVAAEVSVVIGALVGAVLAAREFWAPADRFVGWVKADVYKAPLFLITIALMVLVKNAVVASQLLEIEASRVNPKGNRHQRRAAEAQQRKR